MAFKELAVKRYSVRKFKTDPVEKEKLDLVLEAIRSAPTAANQQPQRVLVVTSEEGLRKMDAVTPCRFGAPAVLLMCFDKSKAWVRPTDKADSGLVDASIAATQAMLQAADIGLGTTWVMFFDTAKAREEFNLGANLVPVAVLPLGYPADDALPAAFHTQRQPLENIAAFEHF
ncbi:MAG: nitroreductase family protein [Spirochaetaceae bacterium]|nr:nitroreductase family protein [Spirochaetaceae bacterium]